jgi:hypothetical protein
MGQSDTLIGGSGRDLLDGGRGNDKLMGGNQDDRLSGGLGRDVLDGGRGSDRLNGGHHADTLTGGPGDDVLAGGVGNDWLIGGTGADRMTGGAGSDVFLFSSLIQMAAGSKRDVIVDFATGRDKIDFSAFDADSSTPGCDAFSVLLAGNAAFSAAAQLRYDAGTGLLSGNTDSDPAAEFEILLANKPAGLVLGGDIRPSAPPRNVPPLPSPDPKPFVSLYDKAVVLDHPSAFLALSNAGLTIPEIDRSNPAREGTYHHNVTATRMPNGDNAAVFDGLGSYFEFGDAPDLSVPNTGILTIEAWLRPDALIFPVDEGSGYVHWMGKGELGGGNGPDQMEWAARMYGTDNTDNPWRGNRISGYAFNMEGERGIGSYFQDDIRPGDWIHYVLVINTTPVDALDPGYTKIYRDGSNAPTAPAPWDDTDSLLEFWPDPTTPHLITPGDGDAPLRVGTRDLGSFFKGAVGKVAIYDYELTPQQIQSHYETMWS